MTAEKKKNKIGRPSAYRPEYCDEIVAFMKDGATAVQFAAHIGVDKRSLYDWSAKYPDFSRALGIAQTKSEAFLTKIGMENLHNREFRDGNWRFIMSSRFRHDWGNNPAQISITSNDDTIQSIKKAFNFYTESVSGHPSTTTDDEE